LFCYRPIFFVLPDKTFPSPPLFFLAAKLQSKTHRMLDGGSKSECFKKKHSVKNKKIKTERKTKTKKK